MSEAAIPVQRRSNWPAIYLGAAVVLGAVLAFLVWATPVKDGAKEWTAPMIPGGWMAWTFPVAFFFWLIASLLVLFTILAIRFPEIPRRGVLRIETTRGERLCITLLGSAFSCLGWLVFAGPPVGWGRAIGLA